MLSRNATDEFLQRAILGLVLLLLAWTAIFFGGQTPPEFFGSYCLGIGAALAWVARLWTAERPRLFLHPVLVPIGLFVAYAAWRAQSVAVPYFATAEVMQLALYALVFLVVLHTLGGREESAWLVHGLVALGVGLSVYALIQSLNQSDSILWLRQPPHYFKRAGATFVNPNHLAGFLVPLVPLSLAQALISRQPAWLRVTHGLAVLLLYTGIGVSMSRGGWLAAAVVTLGFLVWLMARRPPMRLAAVAMLGALVIAAAVFITNNAKARARIEGVNVAGNVESGLRNYIWEPAWREFLAHRTWGVGPAQFNVHFPQFRSPVMQFEPGWCHNEYLNLLCDYGTVGATLVGLAGLIMLGNIYWVRKYAERGVSQLGSRGSDRTALFLGTNLGLLGLGIHSFGEFLLHTPAVALLAALLLALSAGSIRHATERFRVPAPAWARFVLTLACGALACWLLPKAYSRAREGVHLRRAETYTQITPGLIRELIAAGRLEPGNPLTAYQLGENYRRLSFVGDPTWQTEAEQALKWLELAAKLNPHNPITHLRIGLTWYWLKDLGKFHRSIERAVDLGPNLVEVANHYAWSLLVQGRPRKARIILHDSLTWDPWGNWKAKQYDAEITAGKWPDREPKP